MKKFSVIIALILLVSLAIPVLAIDLPDDVAAPEVNVYRNLLETGDRLYLIYANIEYTTIPDIPVTQAFVWRLIDTDNVTELGQTTGYAYNDSGYGENVYSLYFSASDNLTWNTSYTLKLSGTPAAFASPPVYNFPVNVADYSTVTTQAANRAALTSRILSLASTLNAAWGLTSAESLLFESESGTVLSIFGEAVFRGAINGCQALAPEAFRMVVSDITAADRTWTDNYTANLTGQFAGTWIGNAKTSGGVLFGLGYDITSIIIIIALCVGIVFLNMIITNDHWNAMIDVAIILVAAPHIDFIPLTFTALICSIFVLYEGTKVKSFVG